MADSVRFYFDPICPWCYQTSRWMRRLAELGEVELSWGFFSLEMQNAGQEPEEMASAHARSARALRTAVLARDISETAVGAFYRELGRRVHEEGQDLDAGETVEGSLDDAGLDVALAGKAWSDPSTLDRLGDEHRALCDRTRSFGVPTVVLDGGDGPAVFGPVISAVPGDDDAVELWRHVRWLVRYENFSELKRDRISKPDLESVRRRDR